MKKFFSDFKAFIKRGNVLDMAVGVIVGTAFSAIVTALTNGIIMPLINLLLSLGGNGLDSAYTILKGVYDESGNLDLANSIYIDWGAFITAIINFLIIAMTVFIILRVAMNARGFLTKGHLSKEMKALLISRGIDLKNKEQVKAELVKIEEEKKAQEVEQKEQERLNSTPVLLKEIRDLLKEGSGKTQQDKKSKKKSSQIEDK